MKSRKKVGKETKEFEKGRMRLCRIKTKFLEFIFVLGQAVALYPNKQKINHQN